MDQEKSLLRGRIAAGIAQAGRALVALIVAGCALGGPAPEAAPPGAPLAERSWPAQGEPRAVALMLHGFGDHAESAFGAVAPELAALGFEVFAYDQRGFGHNPDRGAWPGVERLVADAAARMRALKTAHPDLPLILIGESMGGAVALASVGEGAAQADALALIAPALSGGVVGVVPRMALAALTLISPDKRWSGRGLVRIQASDNLDALRALGRDPLYLGRPSAREMTGLIRLMDRAEAAAPAVSIPVLALIGDHDEVIRPDAAEAVARRIPGAQVARLADGWHLLLKDRAARVAITRMTEWMQERTR